MAKTKLKPPKRHIITQNLSIHYLKSLIFDPHNLLPTCICLFIFEIFLNIFIIEKVNYTEIDWKAYMQEVEGFLNGTLDYSKLKGDTGPLVYPAGFLYLYSLLYYITSYGTNIHVAQYIFLVIYMAQLLLTYRIFLKTSKIPPYALIIVTLTSYRIHSIYVLRLFNDTIAVLLLFASLNLFMSNKWRWGSFLYSLAVSVKMNILLYAPCLLIAYLTSLNYKQVFVNLFICGFVQLILGLPFLLTYPFAYIKGSFDFGRVFDHQWTVNYRFLARELFENSWLHLVLLVIHVLMLAAFAPILKRYLSCFAKLSFITNDLKRQITKERLKKREENEKLTEEQRNYMVMFEKQLIANNRSEESFDVITDGEKESKFEGNMNKVVQLFVLPFFVTNFLGIVCARSLHYQFYCWYFHSLLYLVFSTNFSKPFMFLLLGCIEYCWNVYPSTHFSSLLLHFCHFTLLVGIYKRMKL